MSFKGRERRQESDRDSDHSSQDGNYDQKVQTTRLYIGFLSDRVTKADLEERFSKYGRVSGVSMQKGFAFIQYGREEEANEAIKQENGSMFKGSRIDVARAFESKKRSGRGAGRRSSPSDDRFRDRGREERDGRDRSLVRGEDRFPDNYRKEDRFSRRDDNRSFDSNRDSRRKHDDNIYHRDRRDAPSNLRKKKKKKQKIVEPVNTIGYYKDIVLNPKRSNDCEIIVSDKAYRLYAESVERRIEYLGMLVDMVFPKDDAFISQIIDDMTRRGSLFAIVISRQHEAHGSVTLNILQGNPQEHRNMPLDDAVKLIAHNFHEFIQSRKEKMDRERSAAGPYGGFLPPDREVQFLLNQLADGRFMTLAELDRVMGYLRERKEQLSGVVSTPVSTTTTAATTTTITTAIQNSDQKQQELQQRILSLIGQTPQPVPTPVMDSSKVGQTAQPAVGQLLVGQPPVGQPVVGQGVMNQPGVNPAMVNQPAVGQNTDMQKQQTQQSSTYINFDNPSVKKALDNLIQTGPKLLESIGVTSSENQDVNSSSLLSPNMMRGTMGGQIPSLGGNTGLPGIGSMGNMGMQNEMGGKMGSQDMRKNVGLSGRMGMGSQGMGGNMGNQVRGNIGMNPDRMNMGPMMGSNMGSQFRGNTGMNMERNLGMGSNISQSGMMGQMDRSNMGGNMPGMRGSGMNSMAGMNPRGSMPSGNFQTNSNMMRGGSGVRHPLSGMQIPSQTLGRNNRY